MKHAATVHDEAHAPGPALWTNGDTTRWIIAWLIVVLDAVWLAVTGRSIALEDVQQCLAVIAQLGCVTAGLALMLHGPIARRDPKYRKLAKRLRAGELAILIQALAWLIVFSGSVSVLSYLVVSLAPPLVDNQLAAMDTALGLDWMSWYQWVKAHPQIDEVLRCAYMSGQGQLLLIVVLIGLAGPIRLLRELLSNLLIALLLLFLIAAPFPAAVRFTTMQAPARSAKLTWHRSRTSSRFVTARSRFFPSTPCRAWFRCHRFIPPRRCSISRPPAGPGLHWRSRCRST